MLLIAALLVALAWAGAEFRAKPAVRRVLGAALAVSLIVSMTYFPLAEQFSANSYFTSASKDLLETSIDQLQRGRQEAVLREWTRANGRFGGTYENRGQFAEIVKEAVDGMRK